MKKSKAYEIAQEVKREFDIEHIRRTWRREASRKKSFNTYLTNVLSHNYDESKYILKKVADIIIYDL